MTLNKEELAAELARLTQLLNEGISVLAKWDPAWGDYKVEVIAVEGLAELNRELQEAVERGAA